MRLIQCLCLLSLVLSLQSCATNPSQPGISDQAYAPTPSIENSSFIYRSPPASALQAHGLVR